MLPIIISFVEKYPFSVAPIFGVIPALIWVWFWLKEDLHPEPAKMLTLSFLGGIVAVILVLPVQQLIYDHWVSEGYLAFLLWATLEETFKFGTVYFLALKRKVNDEPVDSIIYLIIAALGFVSLENTLFLTDLIHAGDFTGTFITNGLRFVGSSLLHVLSSGTIGIFMAFSFYKTRQKKILYTIVGIILAIILHTSFNVYIMKVTDVGTVMVFGFVWICIVALLLLFEKVKHIKRIPN